MDKKWIHIGVGIGVAIVVTAITIPKVIKYNEEAKAHKALVAEYEDFKASTKTFFDDTFFNDVDISGLTPEKAFEAIVEDFESRSILVKTEDGEECSFEFSRLNEDYKELLIAIIEDFEGQDISFVEYTQGTVRKDYTHNIAEDIDFERVNLDGFPALSEEGREKSTDAYVAVDKITGNTSVVEETYGNVIKPEALISKLKNAVLKGESEVVLDSTDCIRPSILSGDPVLDETKAYYEKLLQKTLNIDVAGCKVTLKPEKLVSLYDFEAGDVVDEDALDKYVGSLKNKYDTYSKKRDFATSTGEVKSVPAGNYGWLLDREATKDAIREAITSTDNENTVSAVYAIEGRRPADKELLGTYLEVSLRDQKVWMYVDGVCIVTDDCTTGDLIAEDCVTNPGVFAITFMKTDCILRGPTWEDPVSYWVPFDGNIGLHDATWRTDEEFGGDNRNGNGSHGCVNLRLETAGTIYNNLKMDTPIIVWE